MSTAFGDSMITERFSSGINIESLTEMGGAFKSIFSMLSKGFVLLMLINVFLNAFLSAGLFSVLVRRKFSAEEFWSSGARNFWSFFVIQVIMNLIILALFFVVIILPLSFMISGGSMSDYAIMKAGAMLAIAFFILLAVILLVADYARTWQSRAEGNRCFSAIGYGFGQTFRTFFSSLLMMIVIMIVQGAYLVFAAYILGGTKPSTGIVVFLFFIFSQVLFFIRFLLKSFRYGSVISLTE
jgi:hypothetical protein